MIFSFFKKKEKDTNKKKDAPVLKSTADKKNDDNNKDIDKIINKTKKKSKDSKINKEINTTSRKKRSNRTSHVYKDYSNKIKKDANKLVNIQDYLLSPIITEKAQDNIDNNVYSFKCKKDATKQLIALAIESAYGVKPKKVNIVNTKQRSKGIVNRRKTGYIGYTTPKKVKKAYIYLNKTDKIEVK